MEEIQRSLEKKDENKKSSKMLKYLTLIIVVYFIIYGGDRLNIIPWDKAKELIKYVQLYG